MASEEANVETQIQNAFNSDESINNESKGKEEVEKSGEMKGAGRDVFFRLTVKRISDIDTSKQRFYAEFTLRFSWKPDESENENVEKALQLTNYQLHDWEPLWTPQISFPNGLSVELNKINIGRHPFFVPHKKKDGTYEITYDMEVRAFFMEHFELRAYPFDCQDLTIIIKMGNKGGTNKFRLKPDAGLDAFSKIDLLYSVFTEWEQKPSVLTVTHTDARMSKKGGEYPLVLVKFKVQRRYWYYVKRIGIILALLSLSSLWSFSIDLSSIGERLSFIVTLILAVVAFQFTINDSLPVVSFLTFFDKYILFSIIYIFLVGCQSSVVYKVVDETDWDEIDTICFVAFALIWAVIHVGIFINSGKTISKEEAKLSASQNKDETKTLLNNTQAGVIAHHFKHDQETEKLIDSGKPALFVAQPVQG